MADIASLQIRVDSLEARVAERNLDGLTRSGRRAERATDGLTRTFSRFGAVVGTVAGAAAVGGFMKAISSQREFDILNTGLVTATGSAEGAAQAFAALQRFAQETPYDLAQTVEAFTKLQNFGLDPSERALTSYGNTAAAMGKNLNQMIEAVADAATAEFERLKEFGIRAKSQGDTIAFTFAGVTETVKNNAADIEEYLIRLGETNFAGNMERRMETLDGAIANFGDEWDTVFRNIAQNGIGDIVESSVRTATDALASLNSFLASGEFEMYLQAMGEAWGPWAEDGKEAVGIVWDALGDFVAYLQNQYPSDMQVLSDAWTDFPQNIRAVIQLAAVHVAWFVERTKIAAAAIEGYFDAIADGVGGKTLTGAYDDMVAAAERNDQVLRETRDGILAERDASLKATEDKIDAARRLREEYERNQGAATGEDQLAGFRRNRPSAEETVDKKAEAAAQKAMEIRQREFESLRQSLLSEEEAMRESYERRKTIIEQNTAEGSEARANMMARLDEQLREEERQIAESQQRRIDFARQGLLTEEQELEAHFARRREQVLAAIQDPAEQQALLARLQLLKDTERAFLEVQRAEDRDRMLQTHQSAIELERAHIQAQIAELQAGYDQKLIQEEEYLRRREELIRQYNATAAGAERALMQERLEAGEMMFGGLTELARAYGGEQSKSYKALFALQKAFTVASAALDIQKTISAAMAMGWPQNIPLIAQAVAQGAQVMASIRGTNYAGAYDAGGWIPAGSVGTVAERGDEIVNGRLVRGPAKVVSRKETAKMLAGAGAGDTYVSITVNTDGTTTTESSGDNAEVAKQLGHQIELKVKDVIIREKRPGGLLYQPRVA